MDTAIAANTGASSFTGKLVVSMIQQSLQKTPAATVPAVPGKGTKIDVQV